MNKKLVKKKMNEITPNSKNEKVHSDENMELIISSLKDLGYISPIIIDENCQILAGHGRYEGINHLIKTGEMKDEKYEMVQVEGLSEVEKDKFRIIDNQSARTGHFDNELLIESIGNILEQDVDFNIGVLALDGLVESFGSPMIAMEVSKKKMQSASEIVIDDNINMFVVLISASSEDEVSQLLSNEAVSVKKIS